MWGCCKYPLRSIAKRYPSAQRTGPSLSLSIKFFPINYFIFLGCNHTFNNLAEKLDIPLEISPLVLNIFKDGHKKYGSRAWSSMVVKRIEELNNTNFREEGFPSELIDNEPEKKGYEI